MAARKAKTSSGRGRGRPSKSHHEELIKKLNKANGTQDGAGAKPGRPRKYLKTGKQLAAQDEGKYAGSEDAEDENTDAAEDEDTTGVGAATNTKTEAKRPRGRPRKHPKKIDEEVAVEPEMEDSDADNDNNVGDDGGDEEDADVDGDTIVVGGASQVETKRGRGRPKKDTTLTADTCSAPLSYRGSKATVKTPVPAIVTQPESVAKRRRGRPKKNVEAEVEDADGEVEDADGGVEPEDATNTFTPVNKKTSKPERSHSQRPKKQPKLMNTAELETETDVQDGPIHSSNEVRSPSQPFHHYPSSDNEIFRNVPTNNAHTYAEGMQIPHDQVDESKNQHTSKVVLVSYPGAKEGEGVYRTIGTNVVQNRRKKKNENKNENEVDKPVDGDEKAMDVDTTQEANLDGVDDANQETFNHPETTHFRSGIFDIKTTENAPLPTHREVSLPFKAPQAVMIADSTHSTHRLNSPSMQLVSESSGDDDQAQLYSLLDPSLRPIGAQESAMGMASAALEEVERGSLGFL